MERPMMSLVSQLLVLFLCWLCYHSSTIGSTFVFDDTVAIVKNKDVTETPLNLSRLLKNDFWGASLLDPQSHKSYRPLTIILFHLEYSILGYRAMQMKTVNLLIHCINSLLVWHVIRHMKLSRSLQVSTIAATIFAIHPIHVECISGVVGRAELMFSLVYLISLLVLLRSKQESLKAASVIIILTGIGMLFKETAITIPLACIFLDYMRNNRYEISWKKQFEWLHNVRNLLFSLATIVLLVFRLWVQDFKSPNFKPMDNPVAFNETFLTRVLSQQYLYFINFWIMINPDWLCYDWAMGCIKLITSIWDLRFQAVLALYSFMLFAIRRRDNFVNRLSLGLIVIPFLPASGIIKVGFVIAERILYVPSFGYCLLFAHSFICLLNSLKRGWLRMVVKGLLMLLLISFIARTRERAGEWKTERTLFESGLKVCPGNAKVHYNIARLAAERQDRKIAFKFYENAIKLYPKYEAALMNLGNLYREIGDFETAERYLKESLAVMPDFSTAWMNLGIVQAARKRYSDALASYKLALKYRKNYATCYYNLGNLYLELKSYTLAVQSWQRSLAINPRQPKAWANFLTLLDRQSLYEDALNWSTRALSHLPNETSILLIRANIFGKLKQYVQAEMLYKRILTLEPNNLSSHTNLAVVYHRWGLLDKAIASYRNAVRIHSTKAKTAAKYLESLLSRLERETNVRLMDENERMTNEE